MLTYYQRDLKGFTQLFFGHRFQNFEEFQERWMNIISLHVDSPRATLRLAVQSCKGAGKTTMQAITLIWFSMCFPNAKIKAMSSTKYQTIHVLLHECKLLLKEAKIAHLFDINKFSIALKSPSSLNVISGMVGSEEQPDRAAGDHGDFNLYVIDEASTLGRKVYNSICGIFATGKSYLLLSGNPTDAEGTSIFYEACTSNSVKSEEESALSIFDLDEFRYNRGRWVTMKVAATDLKRPGYHIDAMNDIYPIGSPENEIFVKANFPLFLQSNFIQQRVLRDVTDLNRRNISTELDKLSNNVVIGVDVSYGIGRDYTCVIARCNNQATTLHYSNTTSIDDLGMMIMRWKENGAKVVLDCNGVGRGIMLWLQERKQYVVDVSLSKSATGSILFVNHKSELLWRVKDWLNDYDPYIRFDSSKMEERFIKEGLYMSIEAKDGKYDIGNKKNMSFSPDIFDALSYTFYYGIITMKNEWYNW